MSSIAIENPVLIVEDDEATAELESRALSRSGAGVCTVNTAKEAVALLQHGSFRAVLLDYQLPDGTPWSVLEAAQSHIPRIPVIIVTAMGSERIAEEAIHRGVADYIKKTHTFWDELPGVVERVSRVAELEEANRWLATIVDSSSDAIIGQSLKGIVTSWNRGAARLFGYAPEEIIGKPMALLIPGNAIRKEEEILSQINLDRQVARVELVRSHKDGREIPVSVTISPIIDPAGGVVGISQIARDITEQKEAERRMRLSLKEKEILLKEIHHRVKNNLQVISSLLSLQSGQLSEPSAVRALADCQNRVQSIALVHENLYQVENPSHVDLGQYVRTLMANLCHSQNAAERGISTRLDANGIRLGIDKAIPCGLIINELVTNSLKHAFPGRTGSVYVGFRRSSDQKLELLVEDDGVGLPGKEPKNATTLGLHLVYTLAKQLRADVEVHHQQGMAFKFRFPVEAYVAAH